jgi:hypothetical protein
VVCGGAEGVDLEFKGKIDKGKAEAAEGIKN